MKKIFLSVASVLAGCIYTYAQIYVPPVPVTAGLIQHLDADNGFINGDPPNVYPFAPYCGGTTGGTSFATWADQSGMGNDVKTPPMQTWCACGVTCTVSGINTNANPTLVPAAWSTSYRNWQAVRFDWNDFMETIPGTHHTIGASGLSAANGLAGTDNVKEVTLFVVRTQGSPTVQQIAGNDDTHGLVSLSSTDINDFPGIYSPPGTPHIRDEFCLMRDWATHITQLNHGSLSFQSYDYITYKDHQCFGSTPGNKPVVLSATFGQSFSDLDYYVNGLKSTNSLQDPHGKAGTNHTALDRLITIGARRCNVLGGIDWDEFARADIFEVLVYNRKLTSTEMDLVNNWLTCKYDLQYTACNAYPANCPRACWNSPQLNVSFTSKDPVTGNCSFAATATAPPQAGVTNYGYEWTFPGSSPVLYINTSSIDVQTFTMIPSNGTVKVRILGLNSGKTTGLPCCEFFITAKVFCDDYSGGTRDKPSSTSTIVEDVSLVSIYPNPTDRDLFVKFAESGERTIVVLDFTGKEIKRMTVTEKLNKLSFDAQAAGIYMVRIMDKDGRIIENRKVVYSK